ncbi:MAG TPA: MoaD/ThiS family protein [Actinomycetota bacterium]|nr:MoaD/ThiS family protein [Actinomycetota bacterium]
MSVKVRIPTQLRPLTAGAAEVDAPAGEVGAVIDHLDGLYPGLRDRLLDGDGGLRRFVNVYVGEEDVRFLGGLAAPVADGAAVSIIPAVAGG